MIECNPSPYEAAIYFDLGGAPALIIKSPIDFGFKNQSGGHTCTPCKTRGVALPLVIPEENMNELMGHFYGDGSKWGGWCDKLDEETAQFIHNWWWRFTAKGDYSGMQVLVDRQRLEDSMEAWVHVLINWKKCPTLFQGVEAVFAWPNSD